MRITFLTRQVRLAFLWAVAYTLLVSGEARVRRREEIWSHLLECRGSVLRRTLRGAVADVQWCSEIRRSTGNLGLIAGVVVGEIGGLVTSGGLLLVTVLVSIFVHESRMLHVLPVVAAGVFVAWALRSFYRRKA